MWSDFERTSHRAPRTGAPHWHLGTGTFGTLGTLFLSGLTERWAAIVRVLFWPNHRPHLYEPSGRHFMFWDTLRSDLQHTLRLARKTPLVTSLTVLALALGIGATTAIFAVVDGVLMKPLPYRDGERLVNVWSDATKQGRPRNTLSPANFKDFQEMNQTLEGLEGYFSFVTPFELVSRRPDRNRHRRHRHAATVRLAWPDADPRTCASGRRTTS